jgi:photosystem II stability/assembly factor-like uncharacterized protein
VVLSKGFTPTRLFGIACASTTTCYAVGANGTILRTTGGGATWSQHRRLTTPTPTVTVKPRPAATVTPTATPTKSQAGRTIYLPSIVQRGP